MKIFIDIEYDETSKDLTKVVLVPYEGDILSFNLIKGKIKSIDGLRTWFLDIVRPVVSREPIPTNYKGMINRIGLLLHKVEKPEFVVQDIISQAYVEEILRSIKQENFSSADAVDVVICEELHTQGVNAPPEIVHRAIKMRNLYEQLTES